MALLLAGLVGIGLASPAVRLAGDTPTAQVSVATGFESALLPLSVTAAGALPLEPRPLTGWVELRAPLLQPDLHDHALTLGTRMPVRDRPWDVELGLGLREVSTANDIYRGTSVGSLLMARGGHFGERWTVAADAELWNGWATHVRTTPYARRVGGVQPVSGWTGWTSWSLRAGAVAGALVGPVELAVQLGYESRGRWNLVIPSLYGRVHAGIRF